MATLPEQENLTLQAVEAAVKANADEGFRPHLGASIIGRPCLRQLWYGFRWTLKSDHSPRILRLFARGQREEDVFADLLKGAGIEVDEVDPVTGNQYRYAVIGGHVGGSSDGQAEGIPEAPKTRHIVEMKTHGDKSFKLLAKQGLRESKPEHWTQMQLYMHWSGLTRALYMAVNKNDDQLHIERVRYDELEAVQMEARARTVIEAATPPAKISADPAWYQCKFCDFSDVCHGRTQPERHCRTCLHSTPELDGDARWSCQRWGMDIPTAADQQRGCPEQRLIPALYEQANDCHCVGAKPEENRVFYSNGTADGGKQDAAA